MIHSLYPVLLCSTVNIIACYLLFKRWQQPKQLKSNSLLFSGWLFLFIASYLWSYFYDFEFGLTFNALTSAISAWIFIYFARTAISHSPRPKKVAIRQVNGLNYFSFTEWGMGFITTLSAGPLALIFSLVGTLLLTRGLPISGDNQLVLSAFIFPIVWGLIAFWVCSSPRRLMTFTSLSLSSALAITALWFTY